MLKRAVKVSNDVLTLELHDGRQYIYTRLRQAVARNLFSIALADAAIDYSLLAETSDKLDDDKVLIAEIYRSSDDGIFIARAENEDEFPLTPSEVKTILQY